MDVEVPGDDWEFPEEEEEETTGNPEAHPTKLKPSPTLPSREEVAQHYATHCPYRSWCPICVAASAREDPHRRKTAGRDSESGLPVVAIDYELLEEKITVLVARDLESGATLAYDCEAKGPSDAWMIKQFVKDLEDWGRKDVCIKSDGEPAIIAVQSALAEARTGRTVPLNPPAYNPKANGVAEKAVQDVTDIVRRQILGLESRLKKKVEARLPIVTWILRHAAWTLTRFQVGHDGMTPWRRLVGRSWNGYLAEMGEQVMGKLALKRPANVKKTKRGKKKLEARCVKGTWVGIYPRTGEHILVTTAGDAIRVRTIHRLVEEERWNADVVLAIRSTPRKPCPSAGHADPMPRRVEASEEQPTSGANLERPETDEWRSCPRELQITERLLGKFGYTPGCAGCTFKENELLGHRPHNVTCRQRIYERMTQDADEIDRLNRNEARLGRTPDIPRPNATDFAKAAAAAKPEAEPLREQAQRPTEASESQSHGGAAESPGTPIANDTDGAEPILKEDEDDIPDYVAMSDAEDGEDEGDAELEEHATKRARAPEPEEPASPASKRARALALGTTGIKETKAALTQMLKSAIEVPSMKAILEDLDKLPELNASHSRWRHKIAKDLEVGPEIERLMAIQTALERLEHPVPPRHSARPRQEKDGEDKMMMSLMAAQDKVELLTPPHELPGSVDFTKLYEKFDFYDDVSGLQLDPKLTAAARKLEIDFFKGRGVYTKVKREPWMTVLTTRWLDINKGDRQHPKIRCRLVGREIARERRDDLFAGTPPLESLRAILALCASRQSQKKPARIMALDVSRAYFYAPATRAIHIHIPAEDRVPGDEGMVAKLNLSLYGTRDAAQNWAATYTKFLNACGFRTGKGSPCNFWNEARDMAITVHGDDFTCCGSAEDLRWLQHKFEAKFEVTCSILGPDSGQAQEVKILNRIIRWEKGGIAYEADQRHAELVIRELGLQNAKPVSTPGTKEDTAAGSAPTGGMCLTVEENSELLPAHEASKYRQIAARLNYLALDRTELQYSCKEASRRMAVPRVCDWRMLKRIGRFLVGAPRSIQQFPWQQMPTSLDIFTDSDWAGCQASCRSTSGGIVRWGRHCLKTWSSTQATIALSSAEAELYALTKGAAQALGIIAMMDDFGVFASATIHTDASAALGIVRRQGLGKLRHLNVRYLWMQEQVREKKLAVAKVAGAENPADLVTKHLSFDKIQLHLAKLGMKLSAGRATSAPTLGCLHHVTPF